VLVVVVLRVMLVIGRSGAREEPFIKEKFTAKFAASLHHPSLFLLIARSELVVGAKLKNGTNCGQSDEQRESFLERFGNEMEVGKYKEAFQPFFQFI
jgi:hypothetical protein